MLVLAGTLLAVMLVPLLGGKLSGLATLQLRRIWLVLAALALQILSITIFPDWPRPLLIAMHAGSYALAAAFVWCNRTLPGIFLIAAGGAANAVAIGLNGGVMPASPTALREAGLPLEEAGFSNSGALEDPRLLWLGDVFASPSWLPLRNVYSLGDLVILGGAVWAVQRSCGTVVARRRSVAGVERATG